MTSQELQRLSDILTKSAEYIEELEQHQAEQEKQAQQALAKPYMDKLSQLGFSDEELENLAELPTGTLDKIEKRASHSGTNNWSLGQGSGVSVEGEDPFTEFLKS